mgnify:CR=1 FL=1
MFVQPRPLSLEGHGELWRDSAEAMNPPEGGAETGRTATAFGGRDYQMWKPAYQATRYQA